MKLIDNCNNCKHLIEKLKYFKPPKDTYIMSYYCEKALDDIYANSLHIANPKEFGCIYWEQQDECIEPV